MVRSARANSARVTLSHTASQRRANWGGTTHYSLHSLLRAILIPDLLVEMCHHDHVLRLEEEPLRQTVGPSGEQEL